MYGVLGKIAQIDLTSGRISDYPLKPKDYDTYLGGKTLAAQIIYDSLDKKTDAYSDENMLVITTSILTATTSPCSSRFNVSTISPLTGLLVSSNCGGSFGLQLIKAGYDGLIIRGKSKNRVYIDIENSVITLNSAKHLWGLNTSEAQEQIGGGNRGKIVIGIAGENKVRYAAAISDERALGRGGVGAVFGHKNLKGIVVSGKNKIEFFDKDKFKVHNKNWIKQLKAHSITGQQLPKLGTAGLLNMMQDKHLLATKNYSSGTYIDHEKISGETLRDKYLIKNKGCKTCPIQCGRVVTAFGKTVKGPELETLGLLGSNLLNNDLQKIINLNYLCDEYGLDTITFGSTLGLAMELNEKGLWLNGLNFSDASELEDLVRKVSMRQGIGDDLAEGTKRVSNKYGGKEFAMHVKGMELAAYEPRAAQGMGLGYATSNRGGCHLNGGYLVILEGLGLNIDSQTTKGKAAFTIFFQDVMEAVSASGICLFTTYAMLPDFLLTKPTSFITRLVNKSIPNFGGITGWVHNNTWLMNLNIKGLLPHPYSIKLLTGNKMTIGKFVKAGERGYNLERLINIRQGLSSSDDILPKRMTKELQHSDRPDSKVDLDNMIQSYYKIRGWNAQGIPSPKRLRKLGLIGK